MIAYQRWLPLLGYSAYIPDITETYVQYGIIRHNWTVFPTFVP